MRHLIALALLSSVSAPALAAPQPQYVPPPLPAAPPVLGDGQVVDQLGSVVGGVTKALLDLPVGEVEAAIENRPPTRADRAKTVRSVTGVNERDVDRQMAEGTRAVKASGAALERALPVIVEALNRAGEQIDRATANLPQPGYPRP